MAWIRVPKQGHTILPMLLFGIRNIKRILTVNGHNWFPPIRCLNYLPLPSHVKPVHAPRSSAKLAAVAGAKLVHVQIGPRLAGSVTTLLLKQ